MLASAHLLSVADRSPQQLSDFADRLAKPTSWPDVQVAVTACLELDLPHGTMIVVEGVARGGAQLVFSGLSPRWSDGAQTALHDSSSTPITAAIESRLHCLTVQQLGRRESPVPILGAGSDHERPLQVLGDLLVLQDLLGPLRGRSMVITDGHCAYIRSWVHACALMGINLTLLPTAAPYGLGEFADDIRIASLLGSQIAVSHDRFAAMAQADIVAGDRLLPDAEAVLNRVVFPLDLSGEHADAGGAGTEGPRTLLFHRVERSKDVAAAFISGWL
jgi:hypothetical protein